MALGAHHQVDPEDIPGRTCHSLWFHRDTPCPGCPVVETFRSGRPARGEQTTPDGRHWSLSAFPMRDEAGELVGVVEVARDISHKMAARQSLDRAVADLERAQRIAAIGNWSFDPAVGVPEWSREVYRLYDWDPARPPPRPEDYDRFYQGEDLARFREAFGAAVRQGTPYAITLRLERPGQPTRWIRAIGEPEPEPGPAGHVVHGTLQDITHAGQAEAALRRSEEKLRLALEVAEDGIWDLEMATGAVSCSDGYYALLG